MYIIYISTIFPAIENEQRTPHAIILLRKKLFRLGLFEIPLLQPTKSAKGYVKNFARFARQFTNQIRLARLVDSRYTT